MSNGARHALGVLAGLILTPLIAVGLAFGVGELSVTFQKTLQTPWLGLGVLIATAVLLGFLTGSRISPVASLLAGLLYTLLGAVPWVANTLRIDVDFTSFLPRQLDNGYITLQYLGLFIILGVALLTVSVLPSRWRGKPKAAAQPYYPAQPQQLYAPQQQQQPDPFAAAPDPFAVPPTPTQHLPAFPEQPVDPHDSTRPINRD